MHLLVARHRAHATAYDLVRIDRDDVPPRLPHDVHVKLRLIRETLADLAATAAAEAAKP